MTKKDNSKKKPSNYPDPKKTSMKRWAWEFLRRNPEYRKDVVDYLAVCDLIIPGFNPLHPPAVSREESNKLYFTLIDDERYGVYDPPREPGESKDEWVLRVVSKKLIITPLDVWYARKWGIQSIFDPYTEYEPRLVRFNVSATSVSMAGPHWNGFDDRSKKAVIINFNYPLQPQIDAIKKFSEERRDYLLNNNEISPWPEKRQQNYLLYLQVLDALQDFSGLPFDEQKKEIGNKFYSKIDDSKPSYHRRNSGATAIKVALSLRDDDYIYLPMMTKKVTK